MLDRTVLVLVQVRPNLEVRWGSAEPPNRMFLQAEPEPNQKPVKNPFFAHFPMQFLTHEKVLGKNDQKWPWKSFDEKWFTSNEITFSKSILGNIRFVVANYVI